MTVVDDAELHEDAALRVNGRAVADVAAACADGGIITLVHVSADCVSTASQGGLMTKEICRRRLPQSPPPRRGPDGPATELM